MPPSIRLASALLASVVLFACRNSDATIKTTSSGETNISPSAKTTEARGTAMVRFVNTVDGIRFASLRLNDMVLFDSVKAASVTDYREVDQRMAHLSAYGVGLRDTSALADENRMMEDGTRYSAFLVNENMSTYRLRIVQDDVVPDSGKARIRIMHAAAGAPNVDIRAVNGTENLLSNIAFANNGDFKDIEPATLSLQVREQGTAKLLLTIPAMQLQRGTATTVVIKGSTKLTYFTFIDRMMPAVAAR
jgi:hypothetical protein